MKHHSRTVSLPALFAGVFLAASAAAAKTDGPVPPAAAPACEAAYAPICDLERAVDALARDKAGRDSGADAGWTGKAGPRDSGYWLGIPLSLEPFNRELDRLRRSKSGWFPEKTL